MHLEYFKIFSDLVEKRSFSDAAKSNGITQSAVSQQLKTMENHFNAQIVDRSQKQFRLTQEGEKIYRDSQEILSLYRKLKQAVEIDLGVAILPISAISTLNKGQNLHCIEFKNKPFSRDIALIHRKGKILTSLVKKFIEQVAI